VVSEFLAESKTMKRWAVLTVLIYALALIVLSMPVVLITFGNWGKNDTHIGFHDILDFYSHWAYWLWLGILVAGQTLLLLLPINIAERRLPARRPLKIPIIVTAFFLANLSIAGIFSLLCTALKDNALYIFSFVDLLCGHTAAQNGQPAEIQTTNWGIISSTVMIVAAFWTIWALIFRRFAKSDDENSLVKRTTRWLLRGSILELLVAVPSHIIVRRRDDCCAPAGTFWGIATGISVMLLCFGPGVYFLFVERCQKLKPKSPDADKPV
jgi:hypothetical protein